MMPLPFIKRVVLLLALLVIAGCATSPPVQAPDAPREPPASVGQPAPPEPAPLEQEDAQGPDDSANLAPAPLPDTAGLCPFGLPEMGASWEGVPLTLIQRGGYWTKHDDQLKTPVWVCEELRFEDVHGPLSGRDNWCADPELCGPACNPAQCERGAANRDYTGSGFDRGHLAPNMNQRGDALRKRETFYFSNAAPQVGRGFNQSTWAHFETEMTVHMCVPDRFWTITGLLHLDESGQNRAGERPIVGNGVAVPSHYFKIVVWQAADTVDGFVSVMQNRDHERSESYRDFIEPIEWLETMIDIRFMPKLPESHAEALKVEAGQPLPWTRADCRSLCGKTANC